MSPVSTAGWFGSVIRTSRKGAAFHRQPAHVSVCPASHWQTCKAGAVLSLGQTGFMTTSLSLLHSVLLAVPLGGPPDTSYSPAVHLLIQLLLLLL